MAQVAASGGSGGSGDGTIGYNPEKISSCINSINNAYKSVLTNLIDTNQNTFVSPMASEWGSQTAVDYFKNYNTTIEELKKGIVDTFTSVIATINSVASSLASIATDSWSPKELEGYTNTLDVSCIQTALPDGTIGVRIPGAYDLVSSLDTILSNIESGLDEVVAAVGDSGFIGAGMQDSLRGSIFTIKGQIETAFSDIKTSVRNSMNENNAIYTQTGSAGSSALGGAQG